jgi:hypothetical protein
MDHENDIIRAGAKNHRWLPARRASSRAAAILIPGAKICARSAMSPSDGLVMATADGLRAAGEVPSPPSTPAERLSLWYGRLPSPALEMLRTLAAQGEHFMDADELAAPLGKKPTGSHWNSGITVLRNMA